MAQGTQTPARTQSGPNARNPAASSSADARTSPATSGPSPETARTSSPEAVRELPLAEAAAALGKAPDTVRRLVRQGKLSGRLDASRRLWITVPVEAERPQVGEDAAHLRELLTIREQQVAQLTVELATRRAEAEAAGEERRALLGIVAQAQAQAAGKLLALEVTGRTVDHPLEDGADRPRFTWLPWRRSSTVEAR